jgi:uncharacterized protein (TIGR03000 family)
VTVRVQAGAQVWLSGEKTNKGGTARDFLTPELTPGQKYSYRVRAIWEENGRMHDETLKVPVRAGQHVTVDFPQAGGRGSVAQWW